MNDCDGKNKFLSKAELRKMDKVEIYKKLAYHYKMLSGEVGLIEPDIENVKSIENEIKALEELTEYDDFYKYCNSCGKVQLHQRISDFEYECLACKQQNA
ncbi:Glycosyl transferase family 2 [Moritella viscosa]|uniref:hypothetical protein n=1 Tax=Moritella viscosa TaxID=80854 RepID=UPI000919F6C3|nr:hypothetical protein [Moritella viscosa]SHO23768.1 Glycosyl transferase family 2 [Moritella viscosa]